MSASHIACEYYAFALLALMLSAEVIQHISTRRVWSPEQFCEYQRSYCMFVYYYNQIVAVAKHHANRIVVSL